MKNFYSSLLKKLFFIVLFFGAASLANAQIVNIPDANFKAALVGNAAINTNSYSEIQVSEAIKNICNTYHSEKLYAFACVIINNFNNVSDIDLLVEFKEMNIKLVIV